MERNLKERLQDIADSFAITTGDSPKEAAKKARAKAEAQKKARAAKRAKAKKK